MRAAIRFLASILCVALLAGALVFGVSEWILRRSHEVPLRPIAVPHDAAAIAEGKRLATLTGCRSCHGAEGEGMDWGPGDLLEGRIAPPPLARAIAGYSDPELARLIHHGLRKDGSTVFVMPTVAERNFADADVARIIAWLRTLRPAPGDSRAETAWGPLPRLRMQSGALVPSYEIGEVAERKRPADIGKYYFYAVCSECHQLYWPTRAHNGQVTPGLAPVATSYDAAAFRRLLRTGVGKSRADLGLMSTIAKENLHAFTDAEIDAMRAWLRAEAAKQPRE